VPGNAIELGPFGTEAQALNNTGSMTAIFFKLFIVISFHFLDYFSGAGDGATAFHPPGHSLIYG
jgi:hypothetical protein